MIATIKETALKALFLTFPEICKRSVDKIFSLF